MDKLIQYTGGSILLTAIATVIAFFTLIIGTILLFTSINKNKAIIQTKKIEYTIIIVSIIIVAMGIGGFIGYHFCMYKMI